MKTKIIDFICEVVALAIYGLSKIRLAPRPRYSTCIGEWITCGYKFDRNGFPLFPLDKLAQKLEKELAEERKERELVS